jgi:glycosyltransferase involved in cell wall biosynthesis
MRIGLNAAFLGTGHNGIGTYTRGLIRAFKDQGSSDGQEYVVYTSAENDVPAGLNFTWRRTPPLLCAGRGTFANSLRLLWTQCILPSLLFNDRIDVLLSPLPEIPVFSKTPRVMVVHDLIPLFYPKEAPRLGLYYRYMVPVSLRRASRIVAVSEHTRQDLIREFDIDTGRITVAYSGVDDCHFSRNGLASAPPDCPEKYFLFVGACLPRKNPSDVIQAYAQVQKRLDHNLVIVTPTGNYFNEIERSIRELGLSDRVAFYSALPQRHLLYLYEHATALVFLSKYEGFGYPAAEAMAAGTPAIVSAGTSLPEVVGDAGVVVSPGDSGAVARAMIKLAFDDPERERLRERGLLHCERFQWRAVAEKLGAVLRTVMNGRD